MKLLSKEELYKKNQKTIKLLGIMTPIVFWVLIALSILCFCLAIRNSLGNISQMMSMLDTKKYNDEQLQINYNQLVAQYGELVVGSGSKGFQLVFVNVRNVAFSGFMIFTGVASVIFFIFAFLLGKWLMPLWRKKITEENQDMVNLTILANDKT